MNERGYASLTMDAVAARAGTSRPVLARRWDGRAALAIAALRRRMGDYPVDVPDRGDIRIELMEMLDLAVERASALAITFVLFSTEYLHDKGGTPNDLRATLLEGEVDTLAVILKRGEIRGEIDASKLTRPIARLLPDLFRQHVLTTWSAPDPALRAAWIDTIFLPLVRISFNPAFTAPVGARERNGSTPPSPDVSRS
jgi:AcrR family transcriptional regulator